jgi:hypothetical protein
MTAELQGDVKVAWADFICSGAGPRRSGVGKLTAASWTVCFAQSPPPLQRLRFAGSNPRRAITSIAQAIDFETVKGHAISGVTKVTQVFVNQKGPLPLGKAFQSSGGSFLIFVSGSLWAATSNIMLSIGIFLDGQQIQTCSEFANPAGTHLAMVPVFFTVPKQPAGNHVLELRVVSGGTNSDSNDIYNATVVELA